MIIVFKPNITKKDEAAVLKEIKRLGYRPHIMRGVARTVVGAIGDELTHQTLETLTMTFPAIVENGAGATPLPRPPGASTAPAARLRPAPGSDQGGFHRVRSGHAPGPRPGVAGGCATPCYDPGSAPPPASM